MRSVWSWAVVVGTAGLEKLLDQRRSTKHCRRYDGHGGRGFSQKKDMSLGESHFFASPI